MARIAVLAVVAVVCVVVCCQGKWLKEGEIGYRVSPLSSFLHHVEATDGHSTISAVVSRDHGMTKCRVHNSSDSVSKILNSSTVIHRLIGVAEIDGTWARCRLHDPANSAAVHRWLQSTQREKGPALGYRHHTRAAPPKADYSGLPFPPDYHTGSPAGPGSSFAIVPGTKWCGSGNVAQRYTDLGEHAATDSCCRTHDHCPYYIPAMTSKYHYRNLKPWTLSYCPCDHALFDCLKNVNNTHANAVGSLFFGVLNVECFDFAKGRYCAQYHWTQLWCAEYSTGPMAVTHHSSLHWSNNHNSQVHDNHSSSIQDHHSSQDVVG